jgi:hypothetical protein
LCTAGVAKRLGHRVEATVRCDPHVEAVAEQGCDRVEVTGGDADVDVAVVTRAPADEAVECLATESRQSSVTSDMSAATRSTGYGRHAPRSTIARESGAGRTEALPTPLADSVRVSTVFG